MTLCNYCDTPVEQLTAGDESLDYCPSCEIVVEGNTHECTHKDEQGHDLAELRGELDGTVSWVCSRCDKELDEEDQDALKLQPPLDAWHDAEQAENEQWQAWYGR